MGIKDISEFSVIMVVSIVIGYIGYFYACNDTIDNKEDKYFKISILAFLPYSILQYLNNTYRWDDIKKYFIFIFVVVFMFAVTRKFALYWNKTGKHKLFKKLNKKGVTNYKNNIAIINELIRDTNLDITQIYVYLQDGTILKCTDARAFTDIDFGFLSTDLEKNLAFYVDEIVYPNNKIKEIKKDYIVDEEWGSLLTYIPYAQIKYISIRVKKLKK